MKNIFEPHVSRTTDRKTANHIIFKAGLTHWIMFVQRGYVILVISLAQVF